jgi:hypothetical protein
LGISRDQHPVVACWISNEEKEIPWRLPSG